MYAELSWLAQRRKAVRQILDTLLVEMVVTILVLLYMLIMFINLSMGSLDVEAMADVIVAPPPPPPAPGADEIPGCMTTPIELLFNVLDLIFFTVFLVEILFRLFGFGVNYLRDWINAIDAVVVVVSFVLALVPCIDGPWGLLRVVRFLRFAVVINKLQRSREAAAMARKRAMYRKLGAPVERVLDFLSDFRTRMRLKKDQESLSWMMEARAARRRPRAPHPPVHAAALAPPATAARLRRRPTHHHNPQVIAGDELYNIPELDDELVRQIGGGASEGGADTDISRWLSSETGLKRKNERRSSGGDVSLPSVVGGGGASSSKERRMSAGGADSAGNLWADVVLSEDQVAATLKTLWGPSRPPARPRRLRLPPRRRCSPPPPPQARRRGASTSSASRLS